MWNKIKIFFALLQIPVSKRSQVKSIMSYKYKELVRKQNESEEYLKREKKYEDIFREFDMLDDENDSDVTREMNYYRRKGIVDCGYSKEEIRSRLLRVREEVYNKEIKNAEE